MSDTRPVEAEVLLGLAPEEFVPERRRLVQQLRQEGRAEDAALVAQLRKPSPVVLAVNRAARARPKAARGAADAAVRVRALQLNGDSEGYRKALGKLEESLSLLTEVALAHLAPRGKPSEAMRRRLRDLLRNAVADEAAREALARGVLVEEVETSGFGALEGVAPVRGKKRPAQSSASERGRQASERRQRERELKAELARAEERLRDAEHALREAEHEHAQATRGLEDIRTKLERL
jgi:hypothetical protein